MKKLVFLGLIVGLWIWRARALEACDRRNGYGAYAPLTPTESV